MKPKIIDFLLEAGLKQLGYRIEQDADHDFKVSVSDYKPNGRKTKWLSGTYSSESRNWQDDSHLKYHYFQNFLQD